MTKGKLWLVSELNSVSASCDCRKVVVGKDVYKCSFISSTFCSVGRYFNEMVFRDFFGQFHGKFASYLRESLHVSFINLNFTVVTKLLKKPHHGAVY